MGSQAPTKGQLYKIASMSAQKMTTATAYHTLRPRVCATTTMKTPLLASCSQSLAGRLTTMSSTPASDQPLPCCQTSPTPSLTRRGNHLVRAPSSQFLVCLCLFSASACSSDIAAAPRPNSRTRNPVNSSMVRLLIMNNKERLNMVCSD